MAMIVLGIVSVIGNGMVVYLMSSTKVRNVDNSFGNVRKFKINHIR